MTSDGSAPRRLGGNGDGLPLAPAPQLTFRAVVLSIVLAMILAAANTYLGLFAGMTIASAIPAAVVSMAHAAGVSCEGEIGFVGYAAGTASVGTDPQEAARFARETGIDAIAVSVGNVHLQRGTGGRLDEERIAAIATLTRVPLVIHGGSGVPLEQRRHLAAQSSVCKFNIGTELRQAFGAALRATLAADPEAFDRLAILKATEAPLTEATRAVLRSVRSEGRA